MLYLTVSKVGGIWDWVRISTPSKNCQEHCLWVWSKHENSFLTYGMWQSWKYHVLIDTAFPSSQRTLKSHHLGTYRTGKLGWQIIIPRAANISLNGIPATGGQQLRNEPMHRAQLHHDGHTTYQSYVWLLRARGPVLTPLSWWQGLGRKARGFYRLYVYSLWLPSKRMML